MNPEKFSCIRTVDKTVKIPLWDMYTTTEYKGIEAALDKWKRQYEKQVGGIVVNYKNVSIPSRLGFHSDRGSYAIYNVRATFDVFCPKVGEIVKGKINRVSSEHIGCLIAETINVSIRLPRDSPSGLSKYIYLDREILFEIRSFSCKPRALCVNGEVTAKCVELMDEFYPVTDEFSYEPTSQAVFGDVPSDAEDLQVDLSILGTDGKKKKGKKRARDETEEEEDATGSPRVKKIKKDLDLTGSQEEEASSTDTPKKGKKKSSTDSPKLKKSKKGLIATNSPGMTRVDDRDTSSTDTPKKGKKHKKKSLMDSPKPKKSLISANGPEMTQEGGDTSSINNSNILKMEGATDSPKVKQIQRLQGELSFIDTPKKAKKKKSSLTDSPKASQEDSSSTESAKKIVPKSTDSSQESQSSSTESDKKEKSSNKKTKKKASKSNESPMKIKKELLSSTEDEGSKKKSKKKPKKKSKDSAKSKDKKKSSKKKGKVTASGDILKKDKKKSKKSSKKDDKSKKKNKKDKSEKKKKPKLSNDGDVTLKEIKSEGM